MEPSKSPCGLILSVETDNNRLEGITEHLESLKGLVAPHDEVISSLGQKQEEILSR